MSHIEQKPEYSPKDVEFLTGRINEEYSNFGIALPCSFCIRNKEDKIIAGCSGSILYGSIYIDQLWVHPDHRNKGLGFELMESVHSCGAGKGCKMSTVCTMNFQEAEDFYLKCGYTMDFERSGYAKNSKCIFMKRAL